MDCMDCFLYPQDDKGQPCAQQVPFQEKNLDFLLKNLDFLIKNLDFIHNHSTEKSMAWCENYGFCIKNEEF